MNAPKLNKQKIALAFAVAVIADAIQIPLTTATMTGVLAVPAEGADFLLDCFVMVIVSALLGFHWLFLPSLVFEVIPGFDLIPTWTGCVAFVVWRRGKRKPIAIVEVQAEIISEPRLLSPPPIPTAQDISSQQKTNQN